MSLIKKNMCHVSPVVMRGHNIFCTERFIESMMGFRPRQGNLRLVFRLFSLTRGLPSIRLK